MKKRVRSALGSPLRVGHVVADVRVGHRKMLLIANWEKDDHGPGGGDFYAHGGMSMQGSASPNAEAAADDAVCEVLR